MFNLLPLTNKRALQYEYRLRRAAVVLWFVTAAFLFAALSLLPPLLLAGQKEGIFREQSIALARNTTGKETEQLEQDVEQIRLRLAALSSQLPAPSFVSLLGSVAQARAEGVSLTRIAFDQTESGAVTVGVAGEAESRTALVAFQKALQGLSVFDTVDLPVGNLAKDTEILFALSASAVRPPLKP